MDELSRYLDVKAENIDTDVFAYWFSKKQEFPCLYKMAKDYLPVLASSASSERVFSIGKNLIGLSRMSLNPQSLESSICLRSWLRAGLISSETLLEKVSTALPIQVEEETDFLQAAIDSSGIFEDLLQLENFCPKSPYVEIDLEIVFEDE